MKNRAKIFLVDDNKEVRDSLSEYLSLHEFEVQAFSSAQGVVDAYLKDRPDLIVLDVMLPDGDGFTLAKELRGHTKVPLIFLTARESESDRLTGFELGGDDYVVKPFSPKELVMRVKALLRRVKHLDEDDLWMASWTLGEEVLRIDEETHRISLNDHEIRLTSSEWKILTYLVFNDESVVSREQILDRCLEYSFEGYDRTVDTHVKNIRAKLSNPGWIETVRGYGYRFSGTRR